MIQDILPKVLDNQYRPNAAATGSDRIFMFGKTESGADGIVAKITEEGFCVPKVEDCESLDESGLTYLFAIDDEQFFMSEDVDADSTGMIPDGFGLEPVRALRMNSPQYLCMAGMTANHLHIWYRDNRFCGRCGQKTVHDAKERMMRCPSCGNMIFPKICPAVIIGLRCGDKLLVSRYANRPASAGWALLAGFCEIGETAEETVIREVMEEVGLKATNVTYFGSQPWGFAGNLSIGYFADVEGSTEVVLDENELSVAKFVSRDELPERKDNVSLTAAMIEAFRKGER